ncbi:MAG: glutamate 5-kinase [Endomicrobiia bacterium]
MKYNKVVIKIGSHLIIKGEEQFLFSIAQQVKLLKDNECKVIIVSSGAIASGLKEYGIISKPTSIVEKQSYAAIGQPWLMNKYIETFKKFNLKVAQILLTREDFDFHDRYLNIKNTLNHLLKMGVIPIVNENDTVVTEEIKLGDNDTLSAIVAAKIDADILILLTDVDGVYNKDPNIYKDAKIIEEVYNIEELLKECSISSKSKFFCGTGGMKTKLEAAKICYLSGVEMVIANGMKDNVISDIVLENKKIGTKFYPTGLSSEITSRDKWIAFGKKIKGKIFVDEGASLALTKDHKSLLPVGVKYVEGKFSKGDVVSIYSVVDNKEIARGIVNYSSDEIEKIKGKKTQEIKKIYQKIKSEEVVHVDNLVLL